MDVISSKIEYNDDKTIETTIEEVIDKASRNRKRIITTYVRKYIKIYGKR